MAEIVRLRTARSVETIVGFLNREGPLLTEAVAGRFGWTLEEARERLKALEADGKVESTLLSYALGRQYGWAATGT